MLIEGEADVCVHGIFWTVLNTFSDSDLPMALNHHFGNSSMQLAFLPTANSIISESRMSCSTNSFGVSSGVICAHVFTRLHIDNHSPMAGNTRGMCVKK